MAKANKKVILCKVETTYGTDAVPVIGTDAMTVLNFSVVPINIRYTDRNQALPFFGNRGQINVGETMQMEFDVEIAGAGAVDAVPGYAPFLRGSAMSQTETPSTGPTVYGVVSDGEESVTIYFNWDGILHIMTGARGTQELRFAEGQAPLNHFTFEGLYGGITDTPAGTPVLNSQEALAMTRANTTFSIHGYAAPLASLTITQANTSEYKNRPNSETIHFTGRSSTAQLTIELPTVTVKDFIEICRVGTTGPISLTHGVAAGNRVLIDAAQAQLTNPRYTEDAGLVMLSMDANLRHTDSGNDEWTYKTQ